MSINSAKKSTRGRPKIDSQAINVRLPREDIDALTRFVDDQDGSPSMPEAIRRILRDWLVKHGYKLQQDEPR